MDSIQPMNYNQMINMLNNMNNNNMMMNNVNMNQFNQMMNYLQMMNNQNNMMNMNMNNNPMMNMMMQMMNNQNMMNMNPMNNFDMNQYMLIFNQLINNFNNFMKNNNNMNNPQPLNNNMMNLVFIYNSNGKEIKYIIPAEPNDSLSTVIGRYITKSGDSNVNLYIFAGVRLDESLTVREQGLIDGSIIYVVETRSIIGANNV